MSEEGKPNCRCVELWERLKTIGNTPEDEAYEAGRREGFALGIEAAAKADFCDPDCDALVPHSGLCDCGGAERRARIRALKLPEVPHGS